NGKIKIIRGQRRSFVHFAAKQAARLDRIAKTGKSLVGFDPALTICYRDEYTQLLGENRGTFDVLLPEEWFVNQFATTRFTEQFSKISNKITDLAGDKYKDPYYLFTHCTERALITQSPLLWQTVLDRFGLKLIPVNVACCGMAGLFGHIAGNLEESYAVYEKNWKGEIQKRNFDHCLITGYSCRSQVERMEGKEAVHPLYVVCDLLEQIKIS
ncbi:MAG: hypothetical protein ACI4M9_06330, partial [Succinivibrio sp.]